MLRARLIQPRAAIAGERRGGFLRKENAWDSSKTQGSKLRRVLARALPLWLNFVKVAHSRDDDDNDNKCCYRLVVLFEVKGAGSWKGNFSVSCHFLVIVFFFCKGMFWKLFPMWHFVYACIVLHFFQNFCLGTILLFHVLLPNFIWIRFIRMLLLNVWWTSILGILRTQTQSCAKVPSNFSPTERWSRILPVSTIVLIVLIHRSIYTRLGYIHGGFTLAEFSRYLIFQLAYFCC